MIEPKMGTKHAIEEPHSVADALFPRVRQRVLALLYGNPDRSFFSNEVVALARSGTGAVQRELASLEAAGLLTSTARGNQKHYKANTAAPVFQELRALVTKTSGLVDVLRAALAGIADQIDAAFVYGSISKRQDTAASDVDLLVVSNSLAYADAYEALESAGEQLGRQVNPTIYTHAELAKRIKQRNSFVTRVLSQEKIWVIGNEESLHGITA
jgi:predicted nucleotidyltransferase